MTTIQHLVQLTIDNDGFAHIRVYDDNDDTDSTMPNNDADCDGTLTDDDCNDNDADSTIVSEDVIVMVFLMIVL